MLFRSWIGQGWYSKGLPGVVDGGPYVRAQIKQIKSDRQNTVIATGSTWQGRNSGYSTDGTWRPHQFGGETVDATQTLADLSAASLDKASWDPVIVADIHDHPVTPQMTESNVITQSFKPVSVLAVSDTAWLIDMGTTLTGWFEITFPALKEKQRILLEYCDHLKQIGRASCRERV